jgi:hypothetical protein
MLIGGAGVGLVLPGAPVTERAAPLHAQVAAGSD